MVQPIRSKRDRAYIDQLAVDLAATYLHADTRDGWLRDNVANFCKMGLHTLHEITNDFKTVARLLIEHSYEIWVPIWETGDPYLVHKVDELLVGWTFTDAPMLIENQHVVGVFNHPALTSIMSDVVWSPSGELARAIPSGTQNIDSLIAFTTAIARWALDGIKGRCEPDSSADVYGEYYEDAMERMRVIRQDGGIRAVSR